MAPTGDLNSNANATEAIMFHTSQLISTTHPGRRSAHHHRTAAALLAGVAVSSSVLLGGVAHAAGPTASTAILVRSTLAPDAPIVPHRTFDDVAYGTLPQQRLDVYQPVTESGRHSGAIVYIHGGGWVGGDEDLASYAEPQLIKNLAAEQGWTVFSVRYRLAPDPADREAGGVAFPAALLDVNRAVRWIKANAERFSIDADQLVVYGWSAGAQLAAMLGTTWNIRSLQPGGLSRALAAVSARPAAVVSISGPLDPKAWGDSSPDRSNVFSGGAVIAAFAGCAGDWYTSCTAAQLAAIDVSSYADRSDPAMYIAHGDLDGIVPAAGQQAVVGRLVAALGAGNVSYDITSSGAAAQRNHCPDAALDYGALQRFLNRVGSRH
jgi:acetyl esterase/lipase